jgi:hypothetical protein
MHGSLAYDAWLSSSSSAKADVREECDWSLESSLRHW